MSLDLTSLAFKVETKEIAQAIDLMEGLAVSVGKLHKIQKDKTAVDKAATAVAIDKLKVDQETAKTSKAQSEAELAATKALAAKTKVIEDQAKAQDTSTKKNKEGTDVLKRQTDILNFMTEGYSRGQASILATAKASGTLTESMQQLGSILLTQRKLIGGDTFDKSISGLTSLKNQYTEIKESIRQFNKESGLSAKQSQELARDKERLIIKMQIEGAGFLEIRKAIRLHNEEYVNAANAVNVLVNEQKDFIRVEREMQNAIRAVSREEERMESIVSSLNTTQNNGVSINEKAARSIAAYEANLKRAGITGEQAATKLDKYKKQQLEVIAIEQKRQVQYLQRGLQPQIGDVVVSLAGGQNPLTVLLQQGDQIRGLIAQTGVEGEALRKAMQGALAGTLISIKQTAGAMLSVLGGAIATTATAASSLVTGPFKIMVAALSDIKNGTATTATALKKFGDSMDIIGKVGIIGLITTVLALGTAFIQTMNEGTELSKVLNLNGATLGLTKKSAYEYAIALNDVGIKTSSAVKVISEMAKVGNLGRDSIGLVTKAAVDLEKYGGVAIEETVKQFSKLKEKPVEALTELAKATGLINPAIITQVKYLQDQGKAADASALAIKAYADATTLATNQLKNDLSPMEKAWKDLTGSIGNAWDSFKTFVTNSPTLINEFKTIAAELAAPFKLISYVLDRMSGKPAWQIRAENTAPTVVSEPKSPTEEQTKLNADLAKSQEKLMSLEDKYMTKDMQRAKNILEIRESTLDYYRKLNPLMNENQVAEKASLKIQELIANMDSKNVKKEKDNSKTFQAPSGNESANLEKQYNYETDLAKKQYESARKIAKSNYEAGKSEKEAYISEDLNLLKMYEQKQLAASENYEAANAKIYTDTIALAIKNRNAALASTTGSEDGAEKRKKIQEDYVQYLTNLGNTFESTQKKSEAAREALQAFIDERSVQAINAYAKATEENEKAFEKFTKTQEDYLVNRDLERKLQDDINKSSGAEVEALKAKAEEQKRWTAEISRTQEALQKSKTDFESALGNPLASDKEIEAAFAAVEKNYKISQKVISDSRIAVENAASDAIVQYYKQAFDRITSGISDAIVTALFEGGKKGKTKLRDVLVNELKKPITATITVAVKTLFSDVAKNALTSLTGNTLDSGSSSTSLLSNLSSLFGGNSIGTGISNFASDIGAELMRNGFSNAGSGISSAFGGAAGYSNLAYGAAGIGGGLFGGLFGGQGSLGGSLGSSLGLAIGGPIGAALGSLAGGLIGSLFGGGTPYNTGGVYKANADGTGSRPSDSSLYDLLPGLKKPGYQDFTKRASPELDTATKDLATGLSTTLNATLKEFGKSGQDILVAFRANGKKALGQLDIGGKFTNFKTGENDPSKAFAEFTKYATGQLVETLRDADLPKWVQNLLDEVPKDSGVEGLQAVLTVINQVQELTKVFNNLPMQNLKNITAEASVELIKLAGGLDTLTSSISSYYDNFYTAEEKLKVQTQNLTRDFKSLGIDILPKTREAFVNLVNSQDLTTEAGRKMYLGLLNLQGGLSAILPPLEDVSKNLEEVTNDAFDKLQEAVNAQKDYYSKLRDTAKASVDTLKGIFDLLSTNIRELYDTVQQTSGMSSAAGKALISKAATTGVLPTQEDLSVAIKSVRDSLSSDNYATRFEAERDALILAGQLTQIQKVAGTNLTTAEKQLKAAEDQLTALEAILVNAKKQIDTARGIDTSVKSVTQALKDLTAAILGEKGSTSTAGTNTNTTESPFVIGGTSPTSAGNSNTEKYTLGTKDKNGNYTIEQPTIAGTFTTVARPDQQSRLEKAQILFDKLKGNGSVKATLESFKANGFTMLELGAVGGYAYADLLRVAQEQGVPRFATGGTHEGGLRLVGESGMEIEATGPSRIYNASQTKSMLDNSDLVEEVRQLRLELKAIAAGQAVNANETLKIQKRWDSDGLPETRLVA